MYYYVRLRKRGTLQTRALRENGKVLVFTSPETAKKATPQDYEGTLVHFDEHPRNKASPISKCDYTIR